MTVTVTSSATTETFLLFGGCYSNLHATTAVLRIAHELDIPRERIICTGDVAAYCADPTATVRIIRESGIRVVMGNCEESLGNSAGDCGCGFAEGSACDRLAVDWYAYADALLGADDRAWMRNLPRRIDLAVGTARLSIVHGSPTRINEFVFASETDAMLRAMIATSNTDGVIGGHCGIPFTRIIDGKAWHNPGAIGMPANDGTPRGWFSLLRSSEGAIEFEHLELNYDYRAAAAAMRSAGLLVGYAETLETGLWPSLDVLSPVERATTGKAIAPSRVVWPLGKASR